MNDRKFRKHLADLAHGRTHTEYHDWSGSERPNPKKPAKKSVRKLETEKAGNSVTILTRAGGSNLGSNADRCG